MARTCTLSEIPDLARHQKQPMALEAELPDVLEITALPANIRDKLAALHGPYGETLVLADLLTSQAQRFLLGLIGRSGLRSVRRWPTCCRSSMRMFSGKQRRSPWLAVRSPRLTGYTWT